MSHIFDIYVVTWIRSGHIVYLGASLDDAMEAVEKHRLEAFIEPRSAPRWEADWTMRIDGWTPDNLVAKKYGYVSNWDGYIVSVYKVSQ